MASRQPSSWLRGASTPVVDGGWSKRAALAQNHEFCDPFAYRTRVWQHVPPAGAVGVCPAQTCGYVPASRHEVSFKPAGRADQGSTGDNARLPDQPRKDIDRPSTVIDPHLDPQPEAPDVGRKRKLDSDPHEPSRRAGSPAGLCCRRTGRTGRARSGPPSLGTQPVQIGPDERQRGAATVARLWFGSSMAPRQGTQVGVVVHMNEIA